MKPLVKTLLVFSLVMVACSEASDCCESTSIPEEIETQPIAETLSEADRVGLVWNDEFDQTSLDTSQWVFDLGDGTAQGIAGWGNNEQQTYTNREKNVSVANGFLTITALKENWEGKNYTSARIKTLDNFSFRYGRIEMRAKFPKQQGTWPAVWLMGESQPTVGWPHCGEIDFVEQNGQDKNKIIGTTHWFDEASAQNAAYSTNAEYPGLTDDFHTFKLFWTPTYIRMFVGTVKYYEIALNDSLPFDQPFFFLVNLAMGGTLGGNIATNFVQDQLMIDYIRVYED